MVLFWILMLLCVSLLLLLFGLFHEIHNQVNYDYCPKELIS